MLMRAGHGRLCLLNCDPSKATKGAGAAQDKRRLQSQAQGHSCTACTHWMEGGIGRQIDRDFFVALSGPLVSAARLRVSSIRKVRLRPDWLAATPHACTGWMSLLHAQSQACLLQASRTDRIKRPNNLSMGNPELPRYWSVLLLNADAFLCVCGRYINASKSGPFDLVTS